ncbi:SGNH/GDSL hydrolase family protein [Stackebrandtia nassauensis]|uniref:SGNH hydrolase-type esterase domain-containing protein n=1 Tax=Stackebrandtia nassauensis (strain DSM 44728 / CIP 108903 / NRRL B-16338 / NBRC 102104 / LLR-40K-21) TaxID=446470 RepID=D3Q5A1_STANL|nr:SGNH/GDSL hydrolase family protein [Stackebrandtia nassauensis]ADD44150.1 hypothetical protein Snas_4505 [Stackebrandtia nassauensis DSM 44728]
MPSPNLRRILAVSTVAAAAVALLSTPAHAVDTSRYVALGDSFTSGPLNTLPVGEPIGCFRSGKNYPSVVSEQLDVAEFTDVSCGGATTEHMLNPQNTPIGTNNPQLDALSADTTLVTLGIGGNDIGFGFGEIILACVSGGALDPFGTPCQDKYVNDGKDELRERIAATRSKVDAVLDQIATRSPEATVVVVGYPAVLPAEKGCWPKVTIAKKDVPYLDSVQQDLNAMLGEAASAAGALYAVNYERGHDVCSDRSDRWVEGIIPTKPAAPVHPNADGSAAMAGPVIDLVGDGVTSPAA